MSFSNNANQNELNREIIQELNMQVNRLVKEIRAKDEEVKSYREKVNTYRHKHRQEKQAA
jgi:TRAP-type mannitol/chloroaromatic compound transport system substrate-binding protein